MDVSSDKGSIKVDGITLPSYPYKLDLEAGITIDIEAVPATGYSFDGWNGSLSGNTNPVSLTMDCEKSISADFSRDSTLTITAAISSLVVILAIVSAIIARRRQAD